jgi:hypothetical protein
MLIWLKHLDRVIRGDATQPSALRTGEIEQPVSGLVVIGIILGALYGLCMGSYALFQKASMPLLQMIATTIKVPVLFFLTLAITFPSLYVFNALVGSRLSILSVVRLLVIALAVMLAVLASLGPIVAFFSASTTSYPFMLLLNVLFYTIAGFLGLRCLLVTLNRLSAAIAQAETAATATVLGQPAGSSAVEQGTPSGENVTYQVLRPTVIDAPSIPPMPQAGVPGSPAAFAQPAPRAGVTATAPKSPNRDVITVFRIWILVFGLVGAQMAWVLRPFLGSPHHLFTWFRPRSSNFFEAIIYALQHLFK